MRIRDVMIAAPWCETITAVVEAATMDRNSSVKAMYQLHDQDADTVCDANQDFETVSWAGFKKGHPEALEAGHLVGEETASVEGSGACADQANPCMGIAWHMRGKEPIVSSEGISRDSSLLSGRMIIRKICTVGVGPTSIHVELGPPCI